jgi:Helix-turn-helix domain
VRRLAQVSRVPADSGAEVVVNLIVSILAPRVAELLGQQARSDALVDLALVVPGSRRSLYRACRAGEIAGAARVGRRWLAPRASLDAWLRARGPRLVPAHDDADDELEPLRRSLGRGR